MGKRRIVILWSSDFIETTFWCIKVCVDLINHGKEFTINNINVTLFWDFKKASFKVFRDSVSSRAFISGLVKQEHIISIIKEFILLAVLI